MTEQFATLKSNVKLSLLDSASSFGDGFPSRAVVIQKGRYEMSELSVCSYRIS